MPNIHPGLNLSLVRPSDPFLALLPPERPSMFQPYIMKSSQEALYHEVFPVTSFKLPVRRTPIRP